MRSCLPASLRLRLPPALRSAARSPLPRPRATAPSLPAPARGSAPPRLPHRVSLSPRTWRSLRQLNPSPAAPPRGQRCVRGRGAAPLAAPRVGERRSGREGRQGPYPPTPDAPMPPALPGVGQRKPGGAGSGLRWGRGAPPSPRPGFLFSKQTVPTGLPRPRARRLPAGSVEIWGVGHRVLMTVRERG